VHVESVVAVVNRGLLPMNTRIARSVHPKGFNLPVASSPPTMSGLTPGTSSMLNAVASLWRQAAAPSLGVLKSPRKVGSPPFGWRPGTMLQEIAKSCHARCFSGLEPAQDKTRYGFLYVVFPVLDEHRKVDVEPDRGLVTGVIAFGPARRVEDRPAPE
jgi:hypothetical protein